MMNSYSFRKAGVAVILIVLLAAGWAYGQEHTQLRYMKTTDMGVTWTGPTQAGNIAAVNQTDVALPSFRAVVNANNELVYVVYFGDASTPGIYAMTGPNFTPTLVMAEGALNFHTAGGQAGNDGTGWTQIGKTPNGNLWITWYGYDASSNVTLWGARSTDNGATWSTPWVIAAAPGTLPATAAYFTMSEFNDADYCFVLFQDENWEQYVLRFPTTTGGTGTYVDLGVASTSGFSYLYSACKPLAYDPTAHYLFVAFRNGASTAIYYSSDRAATFHANSVTGAQRYPSMALRTADQTPFVISNIGVGAAGSIHYAWFSYDEFGYGGGSWTAPDTLAWILDSLGGNPVLYVNEAVFFDATHAVASHNQWGVFTAEALWTSRSTDGGLTWGDFTRRWEYNVNTFDAGSTAQSSILLGTNGTAYIFFAGRIGVTDLSGPGFSNVQLMTPATTLGPYTLSVTIADNNVDPNDNHITFYIPSACGAGNDTLLSDSAHITDQATNSGTYYFHIPTSICGHTVAQGDSIFYYFWGRDLIGNAGEGAEQIIRAGIEWLVVDRPLPTAVNAFALNGNYPNPFNPTTRISFDLPASYPTTVRVFNTLGQEVAVPARDVMLTQGHHELTFDGSALSTGVYYYTLTAGPYSASQKMVLLK
jgi:hypothetical protein